MIFKDVKTPFINSSCNASKSTKCYDYESRLFCHYLNVLGKFLADAFPLALADFTDPSYVTI